MARRKRKDQQRHQSGNPARRALHEDRQLVQEAASRGITPEHLHNARARAAAVGRSVDDVLENIREVTTLDGQSGDPTLMGLMHEPDHPERVVGTIPGSPADQLTAEQVAAKLGVDVDDLMQSVFYKTDVADLRDSDSEVDRAVYQKLRETTMESAERVADELERNIAAARTEAMEFKPTKPLAEFHVSPQGDVRPLLSKASPSGGKSPALDLMHGIMTGDMPMPRSKSEAEAVMRAQGYEPVEEDERAMRRLDEVVDNPGLMDRIREIVPGMGMTADGRWTGFEHVPKGRLGAENVEELMRVLMTPSPDQRITEARLRLADLVRGDGATLVAKSIRELEARAAVEAVAASEYGGAIPHPWEDRPMEEDELRRVLAMTLDSYLSGLRPGWGLGTKELCPDDVMVSADATWSRVEVSIGGTLAEATVQAATLLSVSSATTPESLAQDAISTLDPRLRVVLIDPPGTLQLQGGSSEERARSMACQRQVEHLSSPEDREAMVLLPWESVRLSYVGMAHLVGAAKHLVSRVELRVAVTEEMLREMRQDGWARLGAAFRIQREGMPTLVRLAFHVDVRATRQRQTKTTVWVHDVDPRTAEALLGTGPTIPETRVLREGLLAGLPEEYRLGTEDRPRWAGARAFDEVWSRAQRTARLGHEAQDRGVTVWDLMAEQQLMTPRLRASLRATVGYSAQTLTHLKRAQEVLIDPDQVNMLPAFDGWEEAVRFAADVQLPFEEVFIDLEGPAGSCVTEQLSSTVDGAKLAVRGAYVRRQGTELVIMPYGCLVVADADPDREDTYGVMGEMVFGRVEPRAQAETVSVWAQQVVLDDGFMFSNIAADAGVAEGTGEGTNDAVTIALSEPTKPSGAACYTLLDADDGTEYDKANLAMHVAELRAVGLVVLRALFLLTMSNVELVDGGSRQVRRAALRRDPEALISLLVKVVTNRKDYTSGRGPGDGSRREYSHRFRRRGSVAHYPIGTRMADADPTKVVACGRCGRCRRIYRPATIVGPDDKPLILKSLKLN